MKIKVASVTNLTDARYFAAHEVDYIGFCFDPQSADYISPENALAIKGWISGPEIVAEFANQDVQNIDNIINFLQPDVIEVDATEFNRLNFERQVIIRISRSDDIKLFNPDDALFFLTDTEHDDFPVEYPLMLTVTNDIPAVSLNKYKAVQIKGSTETEVGINDYEELDQKVAYLKAQ